MKVASNRDMVSHLLTYVKVSDIITLSSIKVIVRNVTFKIFKQEVLHIANAIIFTELKSKSVKAEKLAAVLGINEQTLMQVLRFELDEHEQLRLLWLINSLAN